MGARHEVGIARPGEPVLTIPDVRIEGTPWVTDGKQFRLVLSILNKGAGRAPEVARLHRSASQRDHRPERGVRPCAGTRDTGARGVRYDCRRRQTRDVVPASESKNEEVALPKFQSTCSSSVTCRNSVPPGCSTVPRQPSGFTVTSSRCRQTEAAMATASPSLARSWQSGYWTGGRTACSSCSQRSLRG